MKLTGLPEATQRTLATLWEKNLPTMRARIDEIERAAAAAKIGELAAEARRSAESTAHKLAGSLGTFGYQRGTDIARELEQMLQGSGGIDPVRLNELSHALRAELQL